jgi:ParB-like chromosome segregation protein Spo0J
MEKASIEYVSLETLIPYANNARKHSDEQVAQIAASIREFGFNNPVLVGADNGIIAGHGRVLAARKLGLEAVPCLRLDHLTDTQRKAYILADNRLAELGGGWDKEMLEIELADLRDEQFDIDLTGFSETLDSEPEEKTEAKIISCFEVVAECEHEQEQQMVYNLLSERRIKCRLSTL